MELIGGFTALQITVALAAALGASFVRGLTGFGMAILLVPILALALPPVEAMLLEDMLGHRAFGRVTALQWQVSTGLTLDANWKLF